jgi:membrane protein
VAASKPPKKSAAKKGAAKKGPKKSAAKKRAEAPASRDETIDPVDSEERIPTGTSRETGWWPTIKRTVSEFREDDMTDWAAALTYYGLLSLFPALISLVSILGLFGDPERTTSSITDIVTAIGPETAAETFQGPIESITSNRGTAGVLFFVGLATALWSASAYVGAFSRAQNVIYETTEGRPFWRLRPLQIAITLAMVLMLAAVLLALVLTGPIVEAVADPIGVGASAVDVWNLAKWPVLIAVVLLMFAVLYYATPNVKLRGFRFITPGSVFAIVLWAAASALFALYVSQFGSYDKTYGTLGGLVSLLIWMWISNLALLLGAELNAERERTLQLEKGMPGAEKQIQLERRSEPDRPTTA